MDYYGSVELQFEDGTISQATARFDSSEYAWGGELDLPHGVYAGERVTLRLPNLGEATGIIGNYSVASTDSGVTVAFEGDGPPPFGD